MHVSLTLGLWMQMYRDKKLHSLIIIVNFIDSLDLDDIQCIISCDIKQIAFLDIMMMHVLKIFPQLLAQKLKDYIDSWIGNVKKVYDDFKANKSDGIDSAKIKLWRQVWTREKERSRCVVDLDSHFVWSKKMCTLHGTLAEGSTSEYPLPREDALVKIEFNSFCTFTIQIPQEAITILSKLGSGSYGTISKCQIKGISFLLEYILWFAKSPKEAQSHNSRTLQQLILH